MAISKMAARMVKKPCGMAASIPVPGTILELYAVLSRTAFLMSYRVHGWTYAIYVPVSIAKNHVVMSES